MKALIEMIYKHFYWNICVFFRSCAIVSHVHENQKTHCKRLTDELWDCSASLWISCTHTHAHTSSRSSPQTGWAVWRCGCGSAADKHTKRGNTPKIGGTCLYQLWVQLPVTHTQHGADHRLTAEALPQLRLFHSRAVPLWSVSVDSIQSQRRIADLKKRTLGILGDLGFYFLDDVGWTTWSTEMENPVYWVILVGVSVLLVEQGEWWIVS